VTISTGHGGAIDGDEAAQAPGPTVAAWGEPALSLRSLRRSAQPSRRAVLHVHAAGDPAVPGDVASWFTERAFHYYIAVLRLPGRPAPPGRPALPGRLALPGRPALTGRRGKRQLGPAFADLDAACAHLQQTDGIDHVIVTAQGRGAVAAALWSDRGPAAAGPTATADALILSEPAWPARASLHLDIACPVLVLTGAVSDPAAARPRGGRLRRRRVAAARPATAIRLGSHVTWLRLPGSGDQRGHAPEARCAFFDELGRWLGAYMYGQGRDRLL
jgi:hypothetical protein